MGDATDDYRALKQFRRLRREKFGIPCPRCQVEQPKRQPTILEPGYRCPDIYGVVLRDWIEALELKMLAYRHMEFARG